MRSLQNSLPWSLTIALGTENVLIHLSNIALATVVAFLSGIGTHIVYLVNASVITNTNLFCSVDFSGPNRSMCTL